jgi:hypothetical protein
MEIKVQMYVILLLIFISYLYMKIDNITKKLNILENFDATSDAITAAVNAKYTADIDAIRNLSSIAKKINDGGLTCPGKLSTNGIDVNDFPNGWSGGLRFFDGFSSGTLGFGPNGKDMRGWISNGANARFDNAECNSVKVNGDTSVGGNTSVSGKTTVYGGLTSCKSFGVAFQNGSINESKNDASSIYTSVINGMTTGTGDGADGNTYNLAINSWNGIAFNDTCSKKTNIVMNVRDGTINANNINIDNLNSNKIFGKQLYNLIPGAYYLDDGTRLLPIFGSVQRFDNGFPWGMDNSDNLWVVCPGFRLILWKDYDYSGQKIDANNTDGERPIYFKNKYGDSTSSLKLYFRGTELPTIINAGEYSWT